MATIRVFFAAILGAALAVAPIESLAQPDFQEAPVIEVDGVRYSTLITVNFGVPVVTGIGQRAAVDVSDFNAGFTDLINYFNDLEFEYGSYEMEKVFPGADWGETTDVNIRTGQSITVHERSQVFRVDFAEQVPIDSLIAELEGMSEVEWVDEPVVGYFGDSTPDGFPSDATVPMDPAHAETVSFFNSPAATPPPPMPNDPRWTEIETFPGYIYVTDWTSPTFTYRLS